MRTAGWSFPLSASHRLVDSLGEMCFEHPSNTSEEVTRMVTQRTFEADTEFHANSTARLAAGLLFALILVLPAAATFAQSAPAPAATGSPAAAATPLASPAIKGVEEIVVTAQKREQLSQDVPIALTALTASNIQFRGIDDLNDLQ